MDYILNVTMAVAYGSKITYLLFFSTLIFALPFGLMIALARLSNLPSLKALTSTYIWLLRGTPLLLQIFFIYFGLPVFGINLDRMSTAIIAFSLNYAAYFAEIFRAGIQSIDKGQYECADVLGLTYLQTTKRIVIPQMIKRVLPPMGNEFINLVKDTALVYAIGLSEILRAAKIAVVRDFTITPFFIAAVFYLLTTLILTLFFRKMEQKYAYYE
ncbi:MAG: amino acid ABC transporter permease [Eubacteriales bacterium]